MDGESVRTNEWDGHYRKRDYPPEREI